MTDFILNMDAIDLLNHNADHATKIGKTGTPAKPRDNPDFIARVYKVLTGDQLDRQEETVGIILSFLENRLSARVLNDMQAVAQEPARHLAGTSDLRASSPDAENPWSKQSADIHQNLKIWRLTQQFLKQP